MFLACSVTDAGNSSRHSCQVLILTCGEPWLSVGIYIDKQTWISNSLDPKGVRESSFQRPKAVQEPGQVRLHCGENWDIQASVTIYRTVEKQLSGQCLGSRETCLLGGKSQNILCLLDYLTSRAFRQLGDTGDLEKNIFLAQKYFSMWHSGCSGFVAVVIFKFNLVIYLICTKFVFMQVR